MVRELPRYKKFERIQNDVYVELDEAIVLGLSDIGLYLEAGNVQNVLSLIVEDIDFGIVYRINGLLVFIFHSRIVDANNIHNGNFEGLQTVGQESDIDTIEAEIDFLGLLEIGLLGQPEILKTVQSLEGYSLVLGLDLQGLVCQFQQGFEMDQELTGFRGDGHQLLIGLVLEPINHFEQEFGSLEQTDLLSTLGYMSYIQLTNPYRESLFL